MCIGVLLYISLSLYIYIYIYIIIYLSSVRRRGVQTKVHTASPTQLCYIIRCLKLRRLRLGVPT